VSVAVAVYYVREGFVLRIVSGWSRTSGHSLPVSLHHSG